MLTKESTYKEFQQTRFYKEMMTYLTTHSIPNSEVFTKAKAEECMNSMYWRSYFNENLEGIS